MKIDHDAVYDCMNGGMLKGLHYCSRGDIPEAVNVLRITLERAELMHSYLGFLEDDCRSKRLGLGPLVMEEEFTAEEIAWLQKIMAEGGEEEAEEDEETKNQAIEWVMRLAEEYENGIAEKQEGEPEKELETETGG